MCNVQRSVLFANECETFPKLRGEKFKNETFIELL